MRALGLVGKCSRRHWGDIHGTPPRHTPARRRVGIGSPEAFFGELFSPVENRREHQHSLAGVLQIVPLRLWSSKLLSQPQYINQPNKHQGFLQIPAPPQPLEFLLQTPQTLQVLSQRNMPGAYQGKRLAMLEALRCASPSAEHRTEPGFPHHIFIQRRCPARTSRRQTLREADLAGVQQKRGIKTLN